MSRRQDAINARDEIFDRLRLDGLASAYRRAKILLDDDKVAATAHASIIRTMFTAAGVMNPSADDEVEKEDHELSPEELKATIARLKAKGFGQDPGDGGDERAGSAFD